MLWPSDLCGGVRFILCLRDAVPTKLVGGGCDRIGVGPNRSDRQHVANRYHRLVLPMAQRGVGSKVLPRFGWLFHDRDRGRSFWNVGLLPALADPRRTNA